MASKINPIGICDFCGEAIYATWFTVAGPPRLYCSPECGGKAATLARRDEISRQAKERFAKGTWINPASIHPPSPARISDGVRRASMRRVVEGGRNAALVSAAWRVLWVPLQKSAALSSALEKLALGVQISAMTREEQDAHRAYQEEMDAARHVYILTWKRMWYKKQQKALSEDKRAAQREQWRAATRRYRERKRGT